MKIQSGKLIGVDHGIKRIGVAVCDLSWLIAKELMVINRKSRDEDFIRLNHIAKEQQAIAFVVGMPSNLDSATNTYTQSDTVRLWVERFTQTTDLPIVMWDEQLTSYDARELAKQKKRKPTQPIDDLAARLILQSYLDALRDGLATPPLRNNE